MPRVTWRGMTSNRVRVAIEHTGDGLPDDEGAVPTPTPDSTLVFEKPNSVGLPYTGDHVRFMHQATFGANPLLENQLRRLGFSTWIKLQAEHY